MLRIAVGVFMLAWVAQVISIRSGYPFGHYHYTSLLQPQVLGVPVLVPLAWLMMLPPAWSVARLVTRRVSGCLMRPAFILVSALAFTTWSFYFDTLLVRWGMGEWESPGGYFGIRWLNLSGWLIVSGSITFALSPKRLPSGTLVLVYGLTWLAEFAIMLLIGGLTGPAMVGFLIMGGMLLWAGYCYGRGSSSGDTKKRAG